MIDLRGLKNVENDLSEGPLDWSKHWFSMLDEAEGTKVDSEICPKHSPPSPRSVAEGSTTSSNLNRALRSAQV